MIELCENNNIHCYTKANALRNERAISQIFIDTLTIKIISKVS